MVKLPPVAALEPRGRGEPMEKGEAEYRATALESVVPLIQTYIKDNIICNLSTEIDELRNGDEED